MCGTRRVTLAWTRCLERWTKDIWKRLSGSQTPISPLSTFIIDFAPMEFTQLVFFSHLCLSAEFRIKHPKDQQLSRPLTSWVWSKAKGVCPFHPRVLLHLLYSLPSPIPRLVLRLLRTIVISWLSLSILHPHFSFHHLCIVFYPLCWWTVGHSRIHRYIYLLVLTVVKLFPFSSLLWKWLFFLFWLCISRSCFVCKKS